MDHLLDAADQRPHQLDWQAFALGDLLEQLRRQRRRRVHRAVGQLGPLGAGGVDLDDAHLRRGRLGDDQLDQGLEGRPARSTPGAALSSPPIRVSAGSTIASTAARKQACLSS